MKNGLYNKGVYWTKELDDSIKELLSKHYKVIPTFHTYNKVDKLKLPKGCYRACLFGDVVEAQVEDGKVVKIITRLLNRYNPKQDICAAIMLKPSEEKNEAIVKTIWTNAHDDDHETINKSNYVKGE